MFFKYDLQRTPSPINLSLTLPLLLNSTVDLVTPSSPRSSVFVLCSDIGFALRRRRLILARGRHVATWDTKPLRPRRQGQASLGRQSRRYVLSKRMASVEIMRASRGNGRRSKGCAWLGGIRVARTATIEDEHWNTPAARRDSGVAQTNGRCVDTLSTP